MVLYAETAAPFSDLVSFQHVHSVLPRCSLFLGGAEPHGSACRILVPRPGIEPILPALGARSPNHWTAREVSTPLFLTSAEHLLVRMQ